jgi:hypothetical protein
MERFDLIRRITVTACSESTNQCRSERPSGEGPALHPTGLLRENMWPASTWRSQQNILARLGRCFIERYFLICIEANGRMAKEVVENHGHYDYD